MIQTALGIVAFCGVLGAVVSTIAWMFSRTDVAIHKSDATIWRLRYDGSEKSRLAALDTIRERREEIVEKDRELTRLRYCITELSDLAMDNGATCAEVGECLRDESAP